MRLAAGMEHQPFPTPDAAIRSVLRSPLDTKAIDLGHVGAGTSGPWQFAAKLDRDAKVRAILRSFPLERQKVLVGMAFSGQVYPGRRQVTVADIARWIGKSERTVVRWYRQDRERFAGRLQDLGLLETSGG